MSDLDLRARALTLQPAAVRKPIRNRQKGAVIKQKRRPAHRTSACGSKPPQPVNPGGPAAVFISLLSAEKLNLHMMDEPSHGGK